MSAWATAMRNGNTPPLSMGWTPLGRVGADAIGAVARSRWRGGDAVAALVELVIVGVVQLASQAHPSRILVSWRHKSARAALRLSRLFCECRGGPAPKDSKHPARFPIADRYFGGGCSARVVVKMMFEPVTWRSTEKKSSGYCSPVLRPSESMDTDAVSAE